MSKRSMFSLLLFLLCGVSVIAQSSRRPQTAQPPARRPSTSEDASPARNNFFQTESYRVTVESVHRKADNFIVTLVFESLSDKIVRLRWGRYPYQMAEYGPYLVDGKSNKYFLVDFDSARVVNCSGCNITELLPSTKLKTQMLFFGQGNGTSFTFVTTEFSPGFRRPVTIKGLEVTSTEEPTNSGGSSDLPSFVTESYRVVVADVQRDAFTITVTMIFENLLDKPFNIVWGEGKKDNDIWQGAEPYLIDENADRYYLRERDDGKVVWCWWCDTAELLPGTKLKTHFIFKVSGTGTTFTFACKERNPKHARPVVIKGLKAN